VIEFALVGAVEIECAVVIASTPNGSTNYEADMQPVSGRNTLAHSSGYHNLHRGNQVLKMIHLNPNNVVC
jgi:hypothetical protein